MKKLLLIILSFSLINVVSAFDEFVINDIRIVGLQRVSTGSIFNVIPVSVGDRVKFKDYAGNEIKIDGDEFSIVRMVDILCSTKGAGN